jgi:hypothetical protein
MSEIDPYKGIPKGTLSAISLGYPIPKRHRKQLFGRAYPKRQAHISLTDMTSAARTITNNLDPEDIYDLSEMLSDWCIGHWGNGRILTRAEIEDTNPPG